MHRDGLLRSEGDIPARRAGHIFRSNDSECGTIGAERAIVGRGFEDYRENMKRRQLLATGAVAVFASRLPAAGAQMPTAVRIGVTVNDSGIVPVYAKEQGFFEKAGVNVEIQLLTNTGAAAQALVAGAIDIAVVDALQVANAVIHGIPMVCIAGGCAFSKDAPTLVMVTNKNGPIHVPKDLENQTVGVIAHKSLSASIADEWMRVNGGDPAKMKLFELTFPNMNAALERGTIAAALQGEPFLTAGKETQRALGVPFEALGVPFYVNVYAARRAWVAENPVAAKSVVAALFEASKWANTHRPESAAIESRITKIPPEIARRMARNVFATSYEPKLLDPVLEIGARYKLTDRLVKSAEIALPV
jgi:NitT/TauT family transport system substrate-binding protein